MSIEPASGAVSGRYAHLPYRPGIGIMLSNEKRQIFVARRIDTKAEAWQMPQGGIDEGENPAEAAMRELTEETGTGKAEIIRESSDWFYYDLPDYLAGRLWRGKYRGQKQKWFLMRFLGHDSDVDLDTAHPEFDKWKWIDPDKLVDLIVPFKRDLYRSVLAEFKDYFLASG